MAPVPPVRRQVVVPAGADIAFAVFTDQIGTWWPVELGHSVFGAGAQVSLRDDSGRDDGGRDDGGHEEGGRQVVETSPDGREHAVWGTIVDWDPPRRLRMTWHPGRGPERATEVEVRFEPVGDQTLVTLEHRGWERLADPMGARGEYDKGWPTVLNRYVAGMTVVRVDAAGGGALPAG